MKKFITTIVLAFAVVAAGRSQSMSALLIPTDAKSMAQAASSVAFEPLDTLDAEVFFGKWAPKAAGNIMAGLDVWYRVNSKFALSLEGTYFKEKPYEVTSPVGLVSGSFAPNEMIFSLGGVFNAAEYLSIELKAKVFNSKLSPDLSGSAFGADIILRYHGQGFNVAAGACNLGTPIKYGSGKDSYPMPMLAKVGGNYTNSGFTASAEFDYLFTGAVMAGLGLEYDIQNIVSVRAGYHYGDAEKAMPSFASLGLGARFSGVKLDLAYLLANPNIGGSFLLGLGYSF